MPGPFVELVRLPSFPTERLSLSTRTLQRSPLFCANIVKKDPDRARQTSLATAGNKFTKPGAQNKGDPCKFICGTFLLLSTERKNSTRERQTSILNVNSGSRLNKNVLISYHISQIGGRRRNESAYRGACFTAGQKSAAAARRNADCVPIHIRRPLLPSFVPPCAAPAAAAADSVEVFGERAREGGREGECSPREGKRGATRVRRLL